HLTGETHARDTRGLSSGGFGQGRREGVLGRAPAASAATVFRGAVLSSASCEEGEDTALKRTSSRLTGAAMSEKSARGGDAVLDFARGGWGEQCLHFAPLEVELLTSADDADAQSADRELGTFGDIRRIL